MSSRSTDSQDSELDWLRAENRRLVDLLEQHGIEWRAPEPSARAAPESVADPVNFSSTEKIALFRGRTDVFPVRWEAKTSGKTGYTPACANEWVEGVCGKPRIKCADCGNRVSIPLSDTIIYEHLIGKRTIGVYPLLTDDSCHFVAADFDEAEWQDDARAFIESCLSAPTEF